MKITLPHRWAQLGLEKVRTGRSRTQSSDSYGIWWHMEFQTIFLFRTLEGPCLFCLVNIWSHCVSLWKGHVCREMLFFRGGPGVRNGGVSGQYIKVESCSCRNRDSVLGCSCTAAVLVGGKLRRHTDVSLIHPD